MSGRRNPFEEIEELFDQLNSGFSEINETVESELAGSDINVDVAETDEQIVVTADVPGFDPDDIDVSVQDRRLTISAESSAETEAEAEADYYRRERTTRAVSRTITLPTEVEETEASASYENGVLTVELPKVEAERGGVDIEVS
ncbi:MAG: Hsp20/alpha crystallin family protein [Halolamina sp.]|uniref:Hsp20/alpha crystallin family protein n=1 Tax=Halolamina sp. TaxID=1940283 RepID=UPI002FC374FD